ncbi:MAG: hypothetical protein IJZ82_09385 [Lachnospiraceae bacterium]|nr:hypothetical protein [Lachnospiraceae bacterium]
MSEKKMTKYDLKVQRRKEAEANAKKEERIYKIVMTAIVLFFVGFIAYFPIRNVINLYSPYFYVNEEAISTVEFEYNYALAKNSYLNENGYYLSMFGMDTSTIDSQMYDDTMTFADYFAQIAAENIVNTKAMVAAAEAAGFTYDTTEEYDAMIADMEAAAEENGLTLKQYIQQSFGDYATESRLKGVMEETLYAAAYYEAKYEEFLPTEDAIQAHYEANVDDYDSVDYHMLTIDAELPTTNPDGTVPVDEEGNEVAYEPTEEEIATAMAAAMIEAKSAQETVATEGTESKAALKSSVNTLVADFLFDPAREAGDTTYVEDTANNRYLVVSFDARYRNEAPTHDMRAIITTTTDSQAIIDEWKAGEATEESFIELGKLYDENGMADYEFLYEGMPVSSVDERIGEWLEGGRKAGDVTAIDLDDLGYYYALYYVGENDTVWHASIEATLANDAMNAHLEEIAASYTISDPKSNLKYLTVAESTEE